MWIVSPVQGAVGLLRYIKKIYIYCAVVLCQVFLNMSRDVKELWLNTRLKATRACRGSLTRNQVFLESLGVASEKVRTVSPDCPALPSPESTGLLRIIPRIFQGCLSPLENPALHHTLILTQKLRLDLAWLRGTWFKPLQCSLPWSPQCCLRFVRKTTKKIILNVTIDGVRRCDKMAH